MEANKKTEAKDEKKSDAPPCCIDCAMWQKFGRNCYYFWEGKKHCTMWTSDSGEAYMQQQ